MTTGPGDGSGLRFALPDTRQRTGGVEFGDTHETLADCLPESAFVVETRTSTARDDQATAPESARAVSL